MESRPRLYPLMVFIPGSKSIPGPTTDQEKAAYDAGWAGEDNPSPNDERLTTYFNAGGLYSAEFEVERAWVQSNAHKF